MLECNGDLAFLKTAPQRERLTIKPCFYSIGMSYSDDVLLACVPQIQSTLPTGKLLQCAGRKTNIVAVKILDSYRSFRPTIPGIPDEGDRRCQAPLKGTPSWRSPSWLALAVSSRVLSTGSLRAALLSGNHGK